MINSNIAQALIVTAEITGTDLTEHAARLMAQDLSAHPLEQVLVALTRCRREVKGRLTLADILSRLDDGRPGVEEAWAIVAQTLGNESRSIVWTEEMAAAYGVAMNLADDQVAARMAFKEHYNAAVQQARDSKQPVRWSPSLGTDKAGRDAALLDAVRKGRLALEHVQPMLSNPDETRNGRFVLAKDTFKSLPQHP